MSLAGRRREAVARLVRHGRIGTQEELIAALRREGFEATQATLSRDLARLRARRVSLPEGGFHYEIADGEGADALDPVLGLVTSVASNDSLVVVRTRPGSAPAVARAIDLAGLDEVLGTIAGDDTIFVAPAQERRARAAAQRLAELFGLPAGRGGAERLG